MGLPDVGEALLEIKDILAQLLDTWKGTWGHFVSHQMFARGQQIKPNRFLFFLAFFSFWLVNYSRLWGFLSKYIWHKINLSFSVFRIVWSRLVEKSSWQNTCILLHEAWKQQQLVLLHYLQQVWCYKENAISLKLWRHQVETRLCEGTVIISAKYHNYTFDWFLNCRRKEMRLPVKNGIKSGKGVIERGVHLKNH